MRVALIADIHADRHFMRARDVRSIVDAINLLDDIDLVAIAGDFVGHDLGALAPCADELARLRAPTFACLGNHDLYLDADAVTQMLEHVGITVLVNDARELRPGVWIGGLDSKRGRPDATRMACKIPTDAGCIVLGHEPALAREHTFAVHLAGHTHHGQIRVRPFKPMYLPAHSLPWFEGTYELAPGRWIHTTGGIGSTTVPVRIGCPPEIVVLDI